jgi:hypothetical protein
MKTRRNRSFKKNKKMSRKVSKGKKSGKKWTTAIDAAQKTLKKTGDIQAARKSLRKQALTNARKLFGSVSF